MSPKNELALISADSDISQNEPVQLLKIINNNAFIKGYNLNDYEIIVSLTSEEGKFKYWRNKTNKAVKLLQLKIEETKYREGIDISLQERYGRLYMRTAGQKLIQQEYCYELYSYIVDYTSAGEVIFIEDGNLFKLKTDTLKKMLLLKSENEGLRKIRYVPVSQVYAHMLPNTLF